MEPQKITLAVPKKVLAKFKKIAFRQQKSVSKLMVEMMEESNLNEEGYRVARYRHLRRLNAGTVFCFEHPTNHFIISFAPG